MGQEQRGGGAQRELVGMLLPVAAEQKLAVQRGDLRIAAKNALVQRQRKRPLVPDLFPHIAQVFIGAVEMHERQVITDIPRRFALFGHQAETVRSSAVLPAAGRFLIAFVAVRHVQAEGMVITFYRYRIVLVVPRCQLNTGIQRDGLPQDRILLAKRFKGIVSVRHNR